jgi:hypothetical protein
MPPLDVLYSPAALEANRMVRLLGYSEPIVTVKKIMPMRATEDAGLVARWISDEQRRCPHSIWPNATGIFEAASAYIANPYGGTHVNSVRVLLGVGVCFMNRLLWKSNPDGINSLLEIFRQWLRVVDLRCRHSRTGPEPPGPRRSREELQMPFSQAMADVASQVDELLLRPGYMASARELAQACLADPLLGNVDALKFPTDPGNSFDWTQRSLAPERGIEDSPVLLAPQIALALAALHDEYCPGVEPVVSTPVVARVYDDDGNATSDYVLYVRWRAIRERVRALGHYAENWFVRLLRRLERQLWETVPPTARGATELSGQQVGELVEIVREAFNSFELNELVRIHLGDKLFDEHAAENRPLKEVAFDLVDSLERKSRTLEFLAALEKERPTNPRLKAFLARVRTRRQV